MTVVGTRLSCAQCNEVSFEALLFHIPITSDLRFCASHMELRLMARPRTTLASPRTS